MIRSVATFDENIAYHQDDVVFYGGLQGIANRNALRALLDVDLAESPLQEAIAWAAWEYWLNKSCAYHNAKLTAEAAIAIFEQAWEEIQQLQARIEASMARTQHEEQS